MKWQPIETAPKDGTTVLVYWKRPRASEVVVTARNPTGSQWWSAYFGAIPATHWMSLPDLPNE